MRFKETQQYLKPLYSRLKNRSLGRCLGLGPGNLGRQQVPAGRRRWLCCSRTSRLARQVPSGTTSVPARLVRAAASQAHTMRGCACNLLRGTCGWLRPPVVVPSQFGSPRLSRPLSGPYPAPTQPSPTHCRPHPAGRPGDDCGPVQGAQLPGCLRGKCRSATPRCAVLCRPAPCVLLAFLCSAPPGALPELSLPSPELSKPAWQASAMACAAFARQPPRRGRAAPLALYTQPVGCHLHRTPCRFTWACRWATLRGPLV